MCISERCECVNGLSGELARTILESNAKRTRERRDPQLHSTAGSGRGELQCKLVLALQLPGAIAAAKQKAPLTEELSAAMGWEVNNLTPVVDGASEDAAGAKSSIDEFHTGSEDNHVALEVPDGEAVDASAKASISCVKQQTARPETLPARSLPSTKSRMGSKGDDGGTGGAGFVGINYVSRSAEQVALRSSSHNVRSTAPYHRGAVFSCKLGRYLLRALRRRIIAL